MELLRAGEALLPLLAPANLARQLRGSPASSISAELSKTCRVNCFIRHNPRNQHSARCFSSTRSVRLPESSEPPPPPKDSNRSSASDQISALLNSSPSPRPSRSSAFENMRSRFAMNGSSGNRASLANNRQRSPPGRAVDDLLQSINLGAKNATGGFNARPPNDGTADDEMSRQMDIYNMEFLKSEAQTRAPPPLEPPDMRMGSTAGRIVMVNPSANMDAARAFRNLDIVCNQNFVARDFRRQRFHERPGLKRKRLKSERWRRRFKVQFKATIDLVRKMKKQGW